MPKFSLVQLLALFKTEDLILYDIVNSMKKTRDIIQEIEDDLNQDIYSDYVLEEYSENDMITPGEEGFMKGYLDA